MGSSYKFHRDWYRIIIQISQGLVQDHHIDFTGIGTGSSYRFHREWYRIIIYISQGLVQDHHVDFIGKEIVDIPLKQAELSIGIFTSTITHSISWTSSVIDTMSLRF